MLNRDPKRIRNRCPRRIAALIWMRQQQRIAVVKATSKNMRVAMREECLDALGVGNPEGKALVNWTGTWVLYQVAH